MPSPAPWNPGRAPLLPRRDADDDPRWSLLSLGITGASVVAVRSLPFALTLLGALVLHEAAHRVVARAHGARVGWPIFLPAPVFLGTLGALLPVRTWPRSASALLEVGAAGPVAGVVVAGAVFAWRAAVAEPGGDTLPAPLAWWLVAFVVRGDAVALPAADPWAHGAWAACLVTGMNLLPLGQLDGGHVASAVLGERARLVGWVAGALVVALGWWWPWWWVWLAVLGALGGWRPVRADDRPLTLRARLVAGASVATAVLTFVPVPA